MIFSRSLVTAVVVAASAQMAVATPPACLIGAVNTQPNAANFASICGSKAPQVMHSLRGLCGGNLAAAMSAFKSTCASAGHHVVVSQPKPSHSSSSHKHIVTKTVKPTTHHSNQQDSKHSTVHKPTHTIKPKPHTKPEPHTKPMVMSKNMKATHRPAMSGNMKATAMATKAKASPTTKTAVQSPKADSPNNAQQKQTGENAASGRVNVDSFASLVLAAAGLAVFL